MGSGSLVKSPFWGPAVIERSAGPSTVQTREAAGPWLPARSVALTWKVCESSVRPEAVNGEPHSSKPSPSSWQLKLASGSFEAKLNEGLRSDEVEPLAGPEEIVTVGAWVSTVNGRETTALTFPGASIALTKKACGAVRERRARRKRRGARSVRPPIEAADEGRAGLVRGKREARGRVVGEALRAWPRADARLGRGGLGREAQELGVGGLRRALVGQEPRAGAEAARARPGAPRIAPVIPKEALHVPGLAVAQNQLDGAGERLRLTRGPLLTPKRSGGADPQPSSVSQSGVAWSPWFLITARNRSMCWRWRSRPRAYGCRAAASKCS